MRDSGDTTVRLKQVLRKNRETAHHLANILVRFGRNLHGGFHRIFPPEKGAISGYAARIARLTESSG